MPKLIVVKRDGTEQEVEGRPGWSVMEVILANGIDELLALCGGCCSCATCHVHVDAPWVERLPPMSGDEDHLLDFSGCRQPGSRLSCQVEFDETLDGMRVRIAPEY